MPDHVPKSIQISKKNITFIVFLKNRDIASSSTEKYQALSKFRFGTL
jgi:hypothetical protein